jgi:hypothetical protein
MATTTKKAAPAAKAAKPASKPASKPAAAKASAKPAAKAAKTPRAKKTPAPPPEPIPYVSAYEVGNKVNHPIFGDGKVTAIDDEQLSISFSGGDKVVLDSFVKKAGKG